MSFGGEDSLDGQFVGRGGGDADSPRNRRANLRTLPRQLVCHCDLVTLAGLYCERFGGFAFRQFGIEHFNFHALAFRFLAVLVGQMAPRLRQYHPVVIVEMYFRATRTACSLWAFVDVSRSASPSTVCYGLREDELTILRREFERLELGEALLALDASATDTIPRLLELMDPTPTPPASDPPEINFFAAITAAITLFWRWLRGRSTPSARFDSQLEKLARCVAIMNALNASALTARI
jgi:hypothetical protein